jgi:hypothetical protein
VDNLDSAAAAAVAGGTTGNDSASSERPDEQLYAEGSEEQQQQQQQSSSYYYDERPDSVSSQKRRGFLKKLSLWGHQAANKTSKKQAASPPAGSSASVGDGIIMGGGKSETAAMDADYFRYNYMDRTRMSAGGRGEESPGGRRAASVTRIEVAASASAAAGVNGEAGRSEAGGRTEVEQRQVVAGERGDDRAQEQLQQQLEQQQQQQLEQQQPPLVIDPRLSKSLSPCSRKQQSAYSSYIRFVGFLRTGSRDCQFKNMFFFHKIVSSDNCTCQVLIPVSSNNSIPCISKKKKKSYLCDMIMQPSISFFLKVITSLKTLDIIFHKRIRIISTRENGE